MTMEEAMRQRHTVRRYTDRSLPPEITAQLTDRIQAHNRTHGLHMALVTGSGDAFGPLLRLVLAKGVRNYVLLAGPDLPDTEEKLGYCGADVMLFAQTLGLSSRWVGGTFSRRGVQRHTDAGRVSGLLALGYGAVQGVPHKSKTPAEISRYEGTAPGWFTRGVEAVLLAPTALNRQAFTIRGAGNQVSMTCDSGAFSGVDLGIGKYHFELGAGTDQFRWI